LIDGLVRGAGAIIFGVSGLALGAWFAQDQSGAAAAALYTLLPVALATLGAVSFPYLTWRPARAIWRAWTSITATQIALGGAGLVAGLIVAALLTPALTSLPGLAGSVTPAAVSLLTAVLGAWLVLSRQEAFVEMLGRRATPKAETAAVRVPEQLLMDTSAIIDGRIADICETGFVQGTLIIPRFVLDELRHIADSPDSLRRNRGRRGLDILNRLQKDSPVPIRISEVDFDNNQDVDSKLVKMASTYGCPIITNDFNLNRVAELEGVPVLNINLLANAVKTVLLPGEEMVVRIIQEGKEMGQGVGFLDDGTMVVVEGGRRHLNDDLDIVVTRVLQTVAGRMIFAQPK
jgi:uncharacterized protein YacL